MLNFNRSVVLKNFNNGADLHENGIYVRLKPQFWFNYGLRTNRTLTVSISRIQYLLLLLVVMTHILKTIFLNRRKQIKIDFYRLVACNN